MEIWPLLRELLVGPLGFAMLAWAAFAIWSGASRRWLIFSLLFAITASLLGIAAIEAFQQSKRWSPLAEGSMLWSWLFALFGFGAFICATVAVATGLPLVLCRRAAAAIDAKADAHDP